jgi:hypothetical protein
MTLTTKRRLVTFRKAIKIAYTTFWSVIRFQHYEESHPAFEPFRKKPPTIDRHEHSIKERFQLSTKEKLYAVERELHNLRCQIMLNEGPHSGRLTREQTYFLCMYKRERDELKNQHLF